MLAAIVFTAPAAQADSSRCKEGQFCFFADPYFEGDFIYYWDNGLKKSAKLDVRSYGFSTTTSSVVNRTPYYAHIWNANGEHRCLPPGYEFEEVGPAYNDKITHIGLYIDWC
jgi:hypothetical protein